MSSSASYLLSLFGTLSVLALFIQWPRYAGESFVFIIKKTLKLSFIFMACIMALGTAMPYVEGVYRHFRPVDYSKIYIAKSIIPNEDEFKIKFLNMFNSKIKESDKEIFYNDFYFIVYCNIAQ